MAAKKPKGMTRDEILNADDLVREKVDVPEWGLGAVWIRTLTSNERDRFEASVLDKQKAGRLNLRNLRARLVVESLVDEDGNKIFKVSDTEALGAKSASALQRLFNVAQRLSGFSETDAGDILATPVTLD